MLAAPGAARVHAQPADDFVPVTDAMLENPAPADWLMWRHTLNGWGYSPLEQIDRDNVGDLRLVWTRALAPGNDGHIYALDATSGTSPASRSPTLWRAVSMSQ